MIALHDLSIWVASVASVDIRYRLRNSDYHKLPDNITVTVDHLTTLFEFQTMYLPFDIWLHIASFLPSSQLRNLYTVNHALFEIAMDERYKEIRFDFRSDSEEKLVRTQVRRLRSVLFIMSR